MKAVPVVVAALLAMAAMVLAAAMAPGAWPPARASAAPLSGQAPAPTGAVGAGGSLQWPRGAANGSVSAPLPAHASSMHAGLALPPAARPDLALTDDQRLIADHALRTAMEAYLSDRSNPRRLQQLDEHLRGSLPAGAANEARALAVRYDAYLDDHAALLKAQNFADEPDLHRLASWQAQRRQLRERMLGTEVAEQWFGTDDAYLAQALEERRQPVQAVTGEDARRARHLREVVDAATGRLQR